MAMLLAGWAVYRRNAQGYTYRGMILGFIARGEHSSLLATGTRQVLCDTCGVRLVSVRVDFDGTEYVACVACLGDEESPEAIVASDVADDDAIHAVIEDRGAA